MKKRSVSVLLLATLIIGSAVPAAAGPHCGGGGGRGFCGGGGGRGPQCGQYYVDSNGDGICDNFVDNNGDGINDNCPGYGQGQGQGQGRGQGGAAVASPSESTAAKKTTAAKAPTKKATIKKVQKRLNKIGYNCGKANGIMNKKTKNALKKFKKTKGLKANTVINKTTLKALGIS